MYIPQSPLYMQLSFTKVYDYKLDLNHEALQRRINCLELMDNDYFVAGSESAVKRSEEAGFPMPPMDLEQYARKEEAIGRFSEVSYKSTRSNVRLLTASGRF